jgi:hypothetical protein
MVHAGLYPAGNPATAGDVGFVDMSTTITVSSAELSRVGVRRTDLWIWQRFSSSWWQFDSQSNTDADPNTDTDTDIDTNANTDLTQRLMTDTDNNAANIPPTPTPIPTPTPTPIPTQHHPRLVRLRLSQPIRTLSGLQLHEHDGFTV